MAFIHVVQGGPLLLCVNRKIYARHMLFKTNANPTLCYPCVPSLLWNRILVSFIYGSLYEPLIFLHCTYALQEADSLLQGVFVSEAWFRHGRPLFSWGLDYLFEKPLGVLFPSLRFLWLQGPNSLLIVLLTPEFLTPCPHLWGPIFLIKGIFEFEVLSLKGTFRPQKLIWSTIGLEVLIPSSRRFLRSWFLP